MLVGIGKPGPHLSWCYVCSAVTPAAGLSCEGQRSKVVVKGLTGGICHSHYCFAWLNQWCESDSEPLTGDNSMAIATQAQQPAAQETALHPGDSLVSLLLLLLIGLCCRQCVRHPAAEHRQEGVHLLDVGAPGSPSLSATHAQYDYGKAADNYQHLA